MPLSAPGAGAIPEYLGHAGKEGPKPSYEQKAFPLEKTGQLHLVASPEGREGSLTLHQDVDLPPAVLPPAAR